MIGLGKLYPAFKASSGVVIYYIENKNEFHEVCWLFLLCTYHLNVRITAIEDYMRRVNPSIWLGYKHHFNIRENECGKRK